jgi:pimeloyl-ACP methyl ester carboxylesterase
MRTGTGNPRALILALHGGGYDARYWHHPASPSTSLLDAGLAHGFEVIALDRPGNAASLAMAPKGAPLREQADIIFDLIQSEAGSDLPVFLVGHSLGGIIALTMAADPRAARLSGVETAGTPIRFDETGMDMLRTGIAAMKGEAAPFMPKPAREQLKGMFFGPAGRFDPEVVAFGPTEHGAPVVEVEGVLEWLETLEDTLPRIRVPVHWTFARHEVSSLFDDQSQPRIAHLLKHNPFVRFAVQEESAHNISLHHVGRAYHMRVLAFCEEVLALSRRA